MNIKDIQLCADFYQTNYIEMFYFVITYSGKSFILVGEKENFPHLMGIPKQIYRSNGYRNPRTLYNDILSRNSISTRIIPNSIAPTSKMYNKAIHFQNSTDIFWRNTGPLTINFNPNLSHTHLNNVDVLLTDISNGYQKKNILTICERNSSNLLLDSKNTAYYTNIAISENIHCKINNKQY